MEKELNYSYWEIHFISCEENKRWTIARTPQSWEAYQVRQHIPMGGIGDDVAQVLEVFPTSDNNYEWDLCAK